MELVTKAYEVQPQESMWIFYLSPFVKQLSLGKIEVYKKVILFTTRTGFWRDQIICIIGIILLSQLQNNSSDENLSPLGTCLLFVSPIFCIATRMCSKAKIRNDAELFVTLIQRQIVLSFYFFVTVRPHCFEHVKISFLYPLLRRKERWIGAKYFY